MTDEGGDRCAPVIAGRHRGRPLRRVTMAFVGADLRVRPSITNAPPQVPLIRPLRGHLPPGEGFCLCLLYNHLSAPGHRPGSVIKCPVTATTENSTPHSGGRERAAGESPSTVRREGTSGARAGNGPPVPAVIGRRVRASQARIQVEPRTLFMFAQSLIGLGAFFSALSHNKIKTEGV